MTCVYDVTFKLCIYVRTVHVLTACHTAGRRARGGHETKSDLGGEMMKS